MALPVLRAELVRALRERGANGGQPADASTAPSSEETSPRGATSPPRWLPFCGRVDCWSSPMREAVQFRHEMVHAETVETVEQQYPRLLGVGGASALTSGARTAAAARAATAAAADRGTCPGAHFESAKVSTPGCWSEAASGSSGYSSGDGPPALGDCPECAAAPLARATKAHVSSATLAASGGGVVAPPRRGPAAPVFAFGGACLRPASGDALHDLVSIEERARAGRRLRGACAAEYSEPLFASCVRRVFVPPAAADKKPAAGCLTRPMDLV